MAGKSMAELRAELKAQDAELEEIREEIKCFGDRDGAWTLYRWLDAHGVIDAIAYEVRIRAKKLAAAEALQKT